jgi:hypothetical protein
MNPVTSRRISDDYSVQAGAAALGTSKRHGKRANSGGGELAPIDHDNLLALLERPRLHHGDLRALLRRPFASIVDVL